MSEGVVEWIDTGAEVIDVSATCGPDCAVAVADYRDAIQQLEECFTFTAWLETHLAVECPE